MCKNDDVDDNNHYDDIREEQDEDHETLALPFFGVSFGNKPYCCLLSCCNCCRCCGWCVHIHKAPSQCVLMPNGMIRRNLVFVHFLTRLSFATTCSITTTSEQHYCKEEFSFNQICPPWSNKNSLQMLSFRVGSRYGFSWLFSRGFRQETPIKQVKKGTTQCHS